MTDAVLVAVVTAAGGVVAGFAGKAGLDRLRQPGNGLTPAQRDRDVAFQAKVESVLGAIESSFRDMATAMHAVVERIERHSATVAPAASAAVEALPLTKALHSEGLPLTRDIHEAVTGPKRRRRR